MTNVNAQGTIWLPIEGTNDKIAAKAVVVMNPSGGEGGVAESVFVTNFPLDPAKNLTIEQVSDKIGNTPITGTVMPAGGVGLFGWLSAIWKLIGDRLPLTLGQKPPEESLSVAIAAGQQLSLLNTSTERIFVDTLPNGILTTPVIRRNTTTGAALIEPPGVGLCVVWHGFFFSNLSPTIEQTISFRIGNTSTAAYPAFILSSKDYLGHDSPKIIRKLPANTGLFVVISSASDCDIQLMYSIEAV